MKTTIRILLALGCSSLFAQQGTMDFKEMMREAEKARNKADMEQRLNLKPMPAPKARPLTPEEQARELAAQKYHQDQQRPAAIAARSPQGLQIVSFVNTGTGVKLTVRNITPYEVIADATKLLGARLDGGEIFHGGSVVGVLVKAGEATTINIGFIGTTASMAALAWEDTSVWVSASGRCYPDSQQPIAAAHAKLALRSAAERAKKLKIVGADFQLPQKP